VACIVLGGEQAASFEVQLVEADLQERNGEERRSSVHPVEEANLRKGGERRLKGKE
jgi:hypothetical protein